MLVRKSFLKYKQCEKVEFFAILRHFVFDENIQ